MDGVSGVSRCQSPVAFGAKTWTDKGLGFLRLGDVATAFVVESRDA